MKLFANQPNNTINIHHHTNTALRKPLKRCIAEIIIPHPINSAPIVLPMISSLTHQTNERWITWITHRAPTKHCLLNSGANLDKLRIVHVSKNTDVRWIIWQALAQGNSHTVVAEQSYWSPEDIQLLESAGVEGNTQGIVITEK